MKEKKWYQKVSNWVSTIIVVILVPVLMINLSIIYQAKTNEDDVPSVFGYKPFIVLSGSMETDIHIGDLVVVKVIDPAKLEVDDVIAFRDAENTVTTHRIIDIVEKDGEKFFITKGDNNSSQDQNLVEYSDVEGIYRFRVPMVGTIMNSLSKPTTIVIVALAITILFFLWFSVSAKKAKDVEDAEFLEFKRMKELEKQKEAEEFEEFKKSKAKNNDSVDKENKTSEDNKKESKNEDSKDNKKKTGKSTKEAKDVKPVNKKSSTKKTK